MLEVKVFLQQAHDRSRVWVACGWFVERGGLPGARLRLRPWMLLFDYYCYHIELAVLRVTEDKKRKKKEKRKSRKKKSAERIVSTLKQRNFLQHTINVHNTID